MKVSKEMLSRIISEERIRAVVESKLPWSQADFFHLLSEARWYEKLPKDSIAYKIAMAAGEQYDTAQKQARKPLAMTKDDYMKMAVHQNANAPHKFSRWQEYEHYDRIPRDDPSRSVHDIIRKGYPEESLPSRKITASGELANFLNPQWRRLMLHNPKIKQKTGSITTGYGQPDELRDIDLDKEMETFVSPFGYIHALVPTAQSRGGPSFNKESYWVYVGRYAIDKRSGKMFPNADVGKRKSYSYPPVSIDTLNAERENPSPDRDALWGKGAQGSVDVQDPTMEEQLINAIREEIANLNNTEE